MIKLPHNKIKLSAGNNASVPRRQQEFGTPLLCPVTNKLKGFKNNNTTCVKILLSNKLALIWVVGNKYVGL